MPPLTYQLSLDDVDYYATNTTQSEEVRDMAVLIFFELLGCLTGNPCEPTGFETMEIEDLELTFYRTINELVHRAA